MKQYFLLYFILLTACHNDQLGEKQSNDTVGTKKFESQNESITQKNLSAQRNDDSTQIIGAKIYGDFNGDGKKEYAIVIRTKKGQGNPAENGTTDEYSIQFSDSTIKVIKIGCCDPILINEGKLRKDSVDAISTYMAPLNGEVYGMQTYSYSKGKWKEIIKPFLVPAYDNSITLDDLKNRVFVKNDSIYYIDYDFNKNIPVVRNASAD